MKKLRLAILPGDGIGQDVTHAAIPIFKALELPIELIFGDIGWACWKQEGNPIPAKTWEIIKSCDAILLGATTSMPEKEALKALPEHLQSSPPPYLSPIIQLRQQLDLYANVRPCFNITGEGENFNFAVIRENTEGLYAGLDFYPLPDTLHATITADSRWRHLATEDASCSLRLQSRQGLTRLFEYAFSYAHRENFHRVTFADKPNVLRKSSAFAREIFERTAQQYPHIQSDIHNVDAVALWMVKRPQEFGVIVAENMFGDILSDLGAGVMGGLGLASSANIGAKGCYFEPVHGSAPRVKPNCANPGAMFLTIGLLLKHFGYHAESHRIQQALHEVIKEGKHVTYDLNGSASTKTMAQAIIDRCLKPASKKTISFLATGNEIIHGDVQDTNSQFFAKKITQQGGNIYQHLQVSDRKREISSALTYLLGQSDAVIVSGGLGPTSDDMTRFAIADVIKQTLCFNEVAWAHIVHRLERFNLTITESNRQQAFFPANAELYPNENGTAYGCHIEWGNKHIFMLPGPPKECRPLFEKFIVATLERDHFFHPQKTYQWLTLGLIEGEIAPQIDAISKPDSVEIAYRWDYPYLEIKLTADEDEEISIQLKTIETMLTPYIVSRNGKNAFEALEETLHGISEPILVIDEVTQGELKESLSFQNVHYLTKSPSEKSHGLWLQIETSMPLHNQTEFSGTVSLKCEGISDNNRIYSHSLSIPNRNSEVMNYAKSYIAWQIQQFIKYRRS